jgi:hypothetical protein
VVETTIKPITELMLATLPPAAPGVAVQGKRKSKLVLVHVDKGEQQPLLQLRDSDDRSLWKLLLAFFPPGGEEQGAGKMVEHQRGMWGCDRTSKLAVNLDAMLCYLWNEVVVDELDELRLGGDETQFLAQLDAFELADAASSSQRSASAVPC